MQDFSYSVFSIAAIAIHLILNFDLLFGRGKRGIRLPRYRGFLFGTLAYYATDAAWGVFAGLGWVVPWYADSVLFFLSLVAFSWLWGEFAVAYLRLGGRAERVVGRSGAALLAFNLVALAANPFNGCFFRFDALGVYRTGPVRDAAFALLVAYHVLMSLFVLAGVFRSRDEVRRRGMMVLLFGVVVTVAIVLQVVWPLTPFTSLGCLVGNCFLHVFVISDELAARHLAELEDALVRARRAEKARSLFFSIASHDIRTPLNAILGYADLLRLGAADPDETAEALKAIRSSGTTLLKLVEAVLDLAKMDSGKMELHPAPVLPFRSTEEVLSEFRVAASEKGVELVNRTAGVPAVMLDDMRFRQLLSNLVENAVKFTDRGTVTVEASYGGAGLSLSVTDTGCGIPRDLLSHILDPFVQVWDPSHAADRARGTGLGLSICKRIVQLMGGRIDVESEPGKGSAFRVVLPVAAANPEAAEPPAEAAPVLRPENVPQRVLVVDDSPLNRAVITAVLKRAGVGSVDAACDGNEAIEAVRAAAAAGRPHDFVFTDYWMPNKNGVEFVGELRADPRFADLPVCVVTADAEFPDDPQAGLFAGVLLKPLTAAKLAAAFSAARLHPHAAPAILFPVVGTGSGNVA